MLDWWLDHGPPPYVGIAAYLGLIKDKGSSSKGSGNLADLKKLAGPGGMIN